MNLSTMMLKLYLRNPPKLSARDELPLIVLPNGRRIVIEQIDIDVTTLGDRSPRFVTSYRLHRELGAHGQHQTRIGDFHSLEEVANVLQHEAIASVEPRSMHFGKL